MKIRSKYILIAVVGIMFGLMDLNCQTIWTGPTTTFTKVGGADWDLESNQDRITDNIWITRADSQGIFNKATEIVYRTFLSPEDTEWAFGTTASIESLTFQNWQATHNSSPFNLINKDMVVHLITDDIYIDIKFTFWQGSSSGGGFTYERSTNQSLNIEEFKLENKIKLYPNPSKDVIKITGLSNVDGFSIFNVAGSRLLKGKISKKGSIEISELERGLYLLKLENGAIYKFIKQ
ncbi:T9SS type A sorting domain-containing protein [Seonamhaeicola sp. MEBiC1930]|uniref:T9SS type A sorting domain-containing protein n=1 Tax=Seonamhaeicola sp. MEBiC01930 TaxID=2976768 RepID=UPI0032481616